MTEGKRKVKLFKKVTETIHDHREELLELAAALTSRGDSQAEVIEQVVAAVDALIDWAAIGALAGPIGGVVGGAVEVFDGPVATAVVKLFLKGKR